MNKSVCSLPGVVFLRLGGLIVFLVLLYVFNLLAPGLSEPVVDEVLSVFNANVVLVILFSLIFLLAEVFNLLPFPLSLLYPVFNAAGAVLLLAFILSFLSIVDFLTGAGLSSALRPLEVLLYPLVFLIVLVAGYIQVFKRLIPEPIKDASGSAKRWAQVAEEFRKAFSDLFRLLSEELGGR